MIFKEIDIKELFKLMQEHDVTEVSLHDGKASIEIKRNRQSASALETVSSGYAGAVAEYIPPSSVTEVPIVPEAADNYYTIEAPLVGTFYRSPSPESEPFVEVGDKIKCGDVLCIVEAMKSMNEIQADVSGIIKEICIENGEMVEFEQSMFKVETLG